MAATEARPFWPPLSVIFLTLAVASLALSASVAGGGRLGRIRSVRPRGWAWLFGISFLTFFAYWTFFAAIHLLDPTVASFLGRTETLVTIFLGVVFLGERFRRIEIAGGLLVVHSA